MYRSQRLAIKYFAAAMVLFGIMIVAGLTAAYQYVNPDFVFNFLPFNLTKILHIDTMIIWLLMGFIGAIYWFLPEELGIETVGIRIAEWLFYVFCAVVAVVAVVFIFVQYGSSDSWGMWLVNQGRKYVEAPRWAAVAVTLVFAVFAYNIVGTALRARRITGVVAVLMADMVPFLLVYLDAFPAQTNMSEDLYWWWWLVHLWVEATWEVLIGCIMAFSLMHLLGTPRRIVEIWLYIEVGLVLGTGILGLGHHYFWIGTPENWMAIGGFFSALEPLPLLGMVIHAIYDAGSHGMRTTNRPAFFWLLAEAFGNFIGGGVWGFMITLPQINLYAHGTQWTVSHGHFAFYGAYATGIISVIYLVLQRARNVAHVNGMTWRWAFAGLNIGLVGMVGVLLMAGYAQAFIERAQGGSTHDAFIAAQENGLFATSMTSRFIFGLVFAAGYAVLMYDFITLGRRATVRQPEPAAAE